MYKMKLCSEWTDKSQDFQFRECSRDYIGQLFPGTDFCGLLHYCLSPTFSEHIKKKQCSVIMLLKGILTPPPTHQDTPNIFPKRYDHMQQPQFIVSYLQMFFKCNIQIK